MHTLHDLILLVNLLLLLCSLVNQNYYITLPDLMIVWEAFPIEFQMNTIALIPSNAC